MSSEKTLAWLTLHSIAGLGNVAAKHLLCRFGDAANILAADVNDLMSVDGVRRDVAQRIVHREFAADPEQLAKELEGSDVRIVPYPDSQYPQILREIHDPPMLLYIKGKAIPNNLTFVAIVGSRNPTPYGLKAAERIAQGLARRGLGVVSNGARHRFRCSLGVPRRARGYDRGPGDRNRYSLPEIESKAIRQDSWPRSRDL